MLPKLSTLSRCFADSANSAPCGLMYPRLRDEPDTVDRPSADVAEDAEREETEENVRSGDGHEEIAGVGEMDGEGDEGRSKAGNASVSIDSSIGCGVDLMGLLDGERVGREARVYKNRNEGAGTAR